MEITHKTLWGGQGCARLLHLVHFVKALWAVGGLLLTGGVTNMAPFVGGAALAAATAHAAQVPGNREPGLAHEAGKATDKTY